MASTSRLCTFQSTLQTKPPAAFCRNKTPGVALKCNGRPPNSEIFACTALQIQRKQDIVARSSRTNSPAQRGCSQRQRSWQPCRRGSVVVVRAQGAATGVGGEATASSQSSSKAPASVLLSPEKVQVIAGVSAMVTIERAIAAGLKVTGGPVSSPVVLLAAVGLLMAMNNSLSNKVFQFMNPAVDFFDQWMPMFFVPSVAAITLAPLPQGMDLAKSAAMLGLSYVIVLFASAQLVPRVKTALDELGPQLGIRRQRLGGVGGDGMTDGERLAKVGDAVKGLLGGAAQAGAKALASAAVKSNDKDTQKLAAKAAAALDKVADTIGTTKKPTKSSPSLMSNRLLLVAVAAACTVPALAVAAPSNLPLMLAPGLLLTTVAIFTSAKQLPPSIRKWLSPTVTAGLLIAASLAAYGSVFLSSWQQGVRLYSTGAGSILAMLIGPAVGALGFKVHTQRKLLQQSALDLTLVCALIVPFQFIVGAILGRLLQVPPVVTLSLLPAHTTLGIALEMAHLLNANKGLITAGVTIAGTTGISTAQPLLDSWKMRDPVTRGMAVGIASHSLGTSALVAAEPKAAAVAGLTFALKGTMSALLISVPTFRDMLLAIAGCR